MVGVKLEVSNQGTIDNIYIYASSDSLANKEIKRVLKSSSVLWSPSTLNGSPVESKPFILPIIYVIEGRQGDRETYERYRDYFSTLPHLSALPGCNRKQACYIYKPLEITTYEPMRRNQDRKGQVR